MFCLFVFHAFKLDHYFPIYGLFLVSIKIFFTYKPLIIKLYHDLYIHELRFFILLQVELLIFNFLLFKKNENLYHKKCFL